MQKNIQLKALVFIFFVIILGLWFYVNGKLDNFNFSLGSDITNIKSQIGKSVSSMGPDSKAPQLSESIEAVKNILKQEDPATSTDNVSADIAKTVIDKINNSSTTEEVSINYRYDPWKIDFTYLSGAKKIIDEKNQIISLIYGDESSAYVYRKELNEKNFGEWLAKNFDLEELDKENIGNLVFWVRAYEGSGYKSKAYYINYETSIFIITINYKQDADSNKLMNIVNSFKIIK